MNRKKLCIILTMVIIATTSGVLAKVNTPDTPDTATAIADAVQEIVKKGLTPGKDEATSLAATTDALGLLATGDKQHMKLVQTYARKRAKACEALDVMENQALKKTMDAGMLNLLLCEYYLLSKDKDVIPGIKALSTYLAFGQSGVGTWGTEMPDVKTNGLYSQAAGVAANENFGTDNNCTVVIATSLVVARNCGIAAKPVADAIARSQVYLRYYVEKGGIPINLQKPNRNHNGGNRAGHTAIFFHLLGEKGPGKYFTRLALTSGRGVRFEAKWSQAGKFLLENCRSRKALAITSKDATGADLLSKKEIDESIAAGTFNAKKATDEELVAALRSWSMAVRYAAGKQIDKRKLDIDDKLIAMLKSDDRYARYGACAAFRYSKKPVEIVPITTKILQTSTDEAMLHFAVHAVAIRYGRARETEEYKAATKNAVKDFIEVVYRDYPGKDPQNRIATQVAGTLIVMLNRAEFTPFFKDGKGMKEVVPTEKLIPVLKAWLNNPYGNARVAALQVCEQMTEEELKPLYEDIYFAGVDGAPGRGTKSQGLNLLGYKVLGHLRFKEGLDLCLAELEKKKNMGPVMALTSYSLGNLKPHWNKIEPVLKPFMDRPKHTGHNGEFKAIWDKKLKETKTSELRSIKPFLTAARVKASKPLCPKDFE